MPRSFSSLPGSTRQSMAGQRPACRVNPRIKSMAVRLTSRQPSPRNLFRSRGPCDRGSPPAVPGVAGTDSHGRMDHPKVSSQPDIVLQLTSRDGRLTSRDRTGPPNPASGPEPPGKPGPRLLGRSGHPPLGGARSRHVRGADCRIKFGQGHSVGACARLGRGPEGSTEPASAGTGIDRASMSPSVAGRRDGCSARGRARPLVG